MICGDDGSHRVGYFPFSGTTGCSWCAHYASKKNSVIPLHNILDSANPREAQFQSGIGGDRFHDLAAGRGEGPVVTAWAVGALTPTALVRVGASVSYGLVGAEVPPWSRRMGTWPPARRFAS